MLESVECVWGLGRRPSWHSFRLLETRLGATYDRVATERCHQSMVSSVLTIFFFSFLELRASHLHLCVKLDTDIGHP